MKISISDTLMLPVDVATETLLDVEELAKRAGYDANGGGFKNPLGRLRMLGLMSRGRDARASDALFDGSKR